MSSNVHVMHILLYIYDTKKRIYISYKKETTNKSPKPSLPLITKLDKPRDLCGEMWYLSYHSPYGHQT